MTTPAALASLPDIKKFITAGNAIFTLVSKKTGERKTFKVEEKHHETGVATTHYGSRAWFVRLLTGPENSSDYRYLGFMYESGRAAHLYIKNNKDLWGEEAYSAFSWMLSKINGYGTPNFFECAEFWHAGRCGRCGHLLTDPASIERGLGPICAEK